MWDQEVHKVRVSPYVGWLWLWLMYILASYNFPTIISGA